ncbi:MAG: hypothetical protein KGI03_00995 [Patescibacteria group bacterium]|nr:hypothetical protein [Patescibacteria group bacterium]
MNKRTFIIVTQDFSGFGFAKKLMEEGNEVIFAYRFKEPESPEEKVWAKGQPLIGKGYLNRVPLEEVMAKRKQYKDAYWHFDQNHYPEEGELLRKEGFPNVWGGSQLMYDMENERDFGVNLVKKAGLSTPETIEFRSPEEGMAFLDQNEERAFVFKPNAPGDGWETFVPDSDKDPIANSELHAYLDSLNRANTGGYILQERLKGVEVNFEMWLRDGVPFFAFGDLECKKQDNDDYGPMCGGAQDITFTVPIDAKGIQATVGKLAKLPEFKHYTGFLDMNVIVADNDNYFLEFCARYGYPAHVSLLYGLAKSPIGDIMANMTDGDLSNFYEHFKYGFAGCITLYNTEPRKGLPVYIDEDVEKHMFLFDLYKRGDQVLTAGMGEEVLMATGHGFSIVDAAEDVLDHARKVHYPSRKMRTDLARDDYPSNPRDRYLALEAMRYLVP